MEILKLTAPCKDYLWGGNRLREEYGKKSDADKIAESWELSCHKDGESVIANGKDEGKTLTQYVAENKSALGTNCDRFEYFPILIKLIDAKDNLSVQVHPNNDYAMRVEGEYGKTEMWYIVDCNEDAKLIYGFEKEISREEFAKRIEENTLLEVTNNVPVHKGDVFFIEAGTLHAIGSGILIAEIQQNSNVTYRVYDYGRKDAQGNTRPLHVEKALEVSDLTRAADAVEPTQTVVEGCTITQVAKCSYFSVAKIEVDSGISLVNSDSFQAVLITDGEGTIDGIPFVRYDTFFIPADYGSAVLRGKFEALVSCVQK